MQRTMLVLASIALLTFGAIGCSDEDTGADGKGVGPDASAGGKADAAAGKPSIDDGPLPGSNEPAAGRVFEEFMAYDWEIEPGVEQYYCVYKTLEEDLWISDFKPLAPPGTHHVTLGFAEHGPDNAVIRAEDNDPDFPCNGLTLGDNLAYGATVGSGGFSMPDGVAVKIPAGKKLLLSVHVFNVNETTLSGHTGVEIVKQSAKTVKNEAEMIAVNNVGIMVPSGRSTSSSSCTMTADGTILGMIHHMHLTGVRMKTTVEPVEGKPYVVLDEPYEFDNQKLVVLDPPVQLKMGDKLTVECQFDNPTATTFTFGESTGNSEMCINFLYRYPAVADEFNCIN